MEIRLGSLAALVIFANLFFFHNIGSLGQSIIYLVLFVLLLLAWRLPKLVSSDILLVAGIAVPLVGLVFFDNAFIQFLTTITTWTVLGFTYYLTNRNLEFFKNAWDMLWVGFYNAIDYIFSILRIPKFEKHDKYRPIILGLGFGLPIVAVVLLLLANADPVFSQVVAKLPLRIFWSSIIAVLAIPLLVNKVTKNWKVLETAPKGFGTIESNIIQGLLTITLLSFIVIQWPYIFANVAETELHQYGIQTYSEYSRKGFGELLVVSGLIYVVLSISNSSLPVFGLLSGSLTLFALSIFRRVWLYQQYHGGSVIRFFGMMFIVWLVGMLAILVTKNLKLKTNNFLKIEFVWSLVILVLVLVINPDHFIATRWMPTVNNQVDYVYLSRASSDGIEGWKKAYTWAKDTINFLNYKVNDNAQKLNREDRRLLAYSIMILQNLNLRYYQLITTYESSTEIDKYRDYVRTTYSMFANEKDIKNKNFTAEINPALTNFDYDYTSFFITWTGSWARYDRTISKDLYDRLYQFNSSKYQAYLWLKNDLTIEDLISTMNRSLVLRKIVHSYQPESERDYDLDISVRD